MNKCRIPRKVTDVERQEARELIKKALSGASDGEKQEIFMYLFNKGFLDCNTCIDIRKISPLYLDHFFRTLSIFKEDRRTDDIPRELIIGRCFGRPIILKTTDDLKNLYKS